MIIVGEDYRFTQRRIQTPIWRQHNLELRVKNANFELSWDCGQNKQQAFYRWWYPTTILFYLLKFSQSIIKYSINLWCSGIWIVKKAVSNMFKCTFATYISLLSPS